MNQSLEKIVIIGLNLMLLVTIGIPLLVATTQVISETEQTIAFHNFVEEIDAAILYADQNQSPVVKQVLVPTNVSLSTEHNQLLFKVYLGSWHMAARTYRCPLQLTSPNHSGLHWLTVNATNTSIFVTFQPS